MTTKAKVTGKTGTTKPTKTTKKRRVRVTTRPEVTKVDPFTTAHSTGGAKKATAGNINNAPTDDAELGNVAANIAAFAAAKAEVAAAQARLATISGSVMSYAKRVLLGLMVKSQSKAPSQKLVGNNNAIVTTFYQDRTVGMDGKNAGRYDALCKMFGQEVVDEKIAEFTGWAIADEKMKDKTLVAKMRKVLQAGLTAEELTGLFVAEHRSRKGVVENAAELCGNDTGKMDLLLQLTIPTPTLKS